MYLKNIYICDSCETVISIHTHIAKETQHVKLRANVTNLNFSYVFCFIGIDGFSFCVHLSKVCLIIFAVKVTTPLKRRVMMTQFDENLLLNCDRLFIQLPYIIVVVSAGIEKKDGKVLRL